MKSSYTQISHGLKVQESRIGAALIQGLSLSEDIGVLQRIKRLMFNVARTEML